jgi:two-component system chemotaxis sensor kinase CheA
MHQLTRLEEGKEVDGVPSKAHAHDETEAHTSSTPESQPSVETQPVEDAKEPVVPEPADAEPERPTVSPEKENLTFSETVRISTARLDSLLMQIEEMLGVKLSTKQFVTDIKEVMTLFEVWKKEWERRETEIGSIRISLENKFEKEGHGKISPYLDQFWDFIEWNQSQLKQLENRLNPLVKHSDNSARLMGGMVDNLLDDIKQTLMLPFSTLLKIIPKIVRDLSRDQNKDVELITHGSTVEVDRRILEEMKDPLIHILRNYIHNHFTAFRKQD